MNKRSLLELTPLVDVMLIILFLFMFNIGKEAEAIEQETTIVENVLQETNEKLIHTQLKNEILNNYLLEMLESSSYDLNVIFTEILEDYNYEPNDIVIEEHSEILIRKLLVYQALSNYVDIIEFSLSGEENQLYINNNPTDFFISYEDIINEVSFKKKDFLLQEIIINELGKKSKSIVLVTTGVLDNEVYKYGYDFLKHTVLEVIENQDIEYSLYAEIFY